MLKPQRRKCKRLKGVKKSSNHSYTEQSRGYAFPRNNLLATPRCRPRMSRRAQKSAKNHLMKKVEVGKGKAIMVSPNVQEDGEQPAQCSSSSFFENMALEEEKAWVKAPSKNNKNKGNKNKGVRRRNGGGFGAPNEDFLLEHKGF